MAPAAVQPVGHPGQLAADNRPWVEKFRPSGLSDLVAHEEIIAIRTFAVFPRVVSSAERRALVRVSRTETTDVRLYSYTCMHLPAVNRLISTNQLPHLLFYGPPGALLL